MAHACSGSRALPPAWKRVSTAWISTTPDLNVGAPPNKEEEKPKNKLAKSTSRLVWFNVAASVVHLIMLSSILGVWISKGMVTPSTNLTVNRIFVRWGTDPAGGIGGCLAGSRYTNGTELRFRSSDKNCTGKDFVTLSVQSYPEDAGAQLNIAFLSISFFALSFLFQGMVNWAGRGWKHLYHDMFPDPPTAAGVGSINYLRYVEYSISASVMMLGISLVSGIYDLEILLCVFTLTWACMLCGLVAEIFLEFASYSNQSSDPTLKGESRLCFYCAILLHLMGWVCIGMPWWVVTSHNRAAWNGDDVAKSCASSMLSQMMMVQQGEAPPEECVVNQSREPPDFVQQIMISQGILFCSFGVVQLVQVLRYVWKGDTWKFWAEFSYILLSLTAKVVLGSYIAIFLLV